MAGSHDNVDYERISVCNVGRLRAFISLVSSHFISSHLEFCYELTELDSIYDDFRFVIPVAAS